ncbi:hypothetical protein ACFYW9_25310 [Streptomyces sp. NPDC002698]|uniref:hypothetical protein n=1 Tax=Streptomyces sp. NPDC002698 TaxID=3364660 RepID=UPI0036946FD2
MTENTTQFTGTGTEADPLTFTVRTPAPDAAKVAVASLADDARRYEAAYHSAAGLSADVPQDVRRLISEAASAITSSIGVSANARAKAEGIRADRSIYPEGRSEMASAAIREASEKVAEAFSSADLRLTVAEADLYDAARPRISPDAAMPARADLALLTQRFLDNPRGLANTLKSIAQRGDAVGALVADSSYLRDWLDGNGVESELRDAIMTSVRAEVVKAAAESGDPKRSAAGRTSMALVELRRARVAAASYTRHTLNGK